MESPVKRGRQKYKRLQPLMGLIAKATKNAEKAKHRAKAPVKKNECFEPCCKTLNLSYTPEISKHCEK
jgi:hypothetical protein